MVRAGRLRESQTACAEALLPRVGLGYRGVLDPWIQSQPPCLEVLELTAEHFFEQPRERVASLRARYPLLVHGLGLSLGTPGALDEEVLRQFASVVEAADPVWASEHLAFTRTAEVDLGHLNPVAPTRENADLVAEHAIEVMERCGRPLALENIAQHLVVPGQLSAADFLSETCARADCRILLDVANLYVNARNHGYCPFAWLRELDPGRIVQIHVTGYSHVAGRYEDLHAEKTQKEVIDLLIAALEYAPVEAVTLERDRNLESRISIADELEELAMSIRNA